MSTAHGFEVPPFCPNERCPFHTGPTACWHWVRNGCFRRLGAPQRIQRFRCVHCGRHFSEQTFRTTYWLKRPGLLAAVSDDLNGGSCFRQIARKHAASPQTVALLSARLARQAQLFHEQCRPQGEIGEPLVLDSFQSFAFSQYHPLLFHLVVGKHSHYVYGFTCSELRRSGRMTARQKRRRAELERAFGRPDPRSVEREVARVLAIVAPQSQALELYSDEHADYPRAIRRLPHLALTHRTISSRAARTSRNPLFAINLVDLLARHSGANHKRETIAFSKRAQSAIGRLWGFLVWRNYVKWFSERHPGATPAMRAGVCAQRYGVRQLLAQRLFPSRIALPAAWREHYWGRVPTRRIPNARCHQLKYAC